MFVNGLNSQLKGHSIDFKSSSSLDEVIGDVWLVFLEAATPDLGQIIARP